MSQSEWFNGTDPDEGSGGPSEGGAGRPPRGFPVPGRGLPRRWGPLLPTVAILIALAILGAIAASIFTDLWWYESVGFRGVFLTELGTKVLLFVVAGLLTAGAVALSLIVAYRTRPLYVPTTQAQQVLDQYRQALDPLRKIGVVLVPAVLGLLAGSGTMGAWKTYLLWRNAVPFGTKDPQFHLDIGFFVFTLPWLDFVVGFLTVVLVLTLLAGAFTHYVYGGLQLPGRGRSTRAAFIHLSTIGALLALVRGASYWLDRYSLSTSNGDLFTGVTYTDAHAVMPTKAILAVAAVMCAGFFLASIWTRSWRVPLIGVGLLVVMAVVVGGIYPALIQSIKVKPSEKSLESTYIQRNINATRTAYGIDNIKTTTYSATTDVAAGQLRADAATIPGIRLVDPNVVSTTFQQLEGLRQYYQFPDTLDVDRYTINGTSEDAVVAAREINLDGVPADKRNWLNDHTVYTHGFGFVAAYGNQRTAEGNPVFFESGLQPKGPLGEFQPRIYFGEDSPEYSIVGAPPGSQAREFDYPDDSGQGTQKNTTYAGSGGVSIGSLFRRAAYAVKYGEPNFLLSNALNGDSRLLNYRTPKERVERVAPWLTLDGNVYPAVIGGRIQWIVDGFTTTASYPNSELTDLSTDTADAVSQGSTAVTVSSGQVNYIRNSVKAIVDAYDGTVRLYAWDAGDPLLKAWSAAFPGSVRPLSEISGDLMTHFRYPQDLYKVQRQMVAKYHVTDANSFYGGQDFWRVPKDPTHDSQDQPTYYQSLAMPDQSSPAFSLTTTFVPASNSSGGREILRGFMAVDADAGSTSGQRSDQYGTMRLLETPGASAVDGPGQVENQIEVSTARSASPSEPLNLSQFIAQNRQSGKTLTFGNLLTLPVGQGLLYVQPLYVEAANTSGAFPQNKATVAVFGKQVAWGETLNQALDGLFGGNSGATAGDAGVTPPTGTTAPPTRTASSEVAAAIAAIQAAYAEGEAALKKGDLAAYAVAQDKLKAAIERATALESAGSTSSGSSTATPSPSPTTSGGG